MPLRDRVEQLAVLTGAIETGSRGPGGSVVVRGEAGCGKTPLVRAALDALDRPVAVVWTSCEPLTAPTPLGPIIDASHHLFGERIDDRTGTERIFAALKKEPVALVIDDLHWADDATLDVVTRLAPRLEATPSTLVVTYRPSQADPLRGVLGQLARTGARYVDTPPLSPASVSAMAIESGRDGEAVFALTGGVPFLVAAVLAAPGSGMPDTATDAILAMTTGLDGPALRALEVISCVPRVSAAGGPDDLLVPHVVLERLDVRADAIDAAARTGLIEVQPTGAVFRHELGRLAIESTVPGARRRLLHARLRDAFRSTSAELALVAHHAIGAGDDEPIIDICGDAALLATEVGAHRQARDLLAHAVAAARRTRDDRLADLAERSARERYLTNDLVGAIEHERLALGVLLAADAPERVAIAHLSLSRYCWFRGRPDEATTHVESALGVLSDIGGDLRAAALSARCQLAMLQGDLATVERTASEALDLLGADRRPDMRAADTGFRQAEATQLYRKHGFEITTPLGDVDARLARGLTFMRRALTPGLNRIDAGNWWI